MKAKRKPRPFGGGSLDRSAAHPQNSAHSSSRGGSHCQRPEWREMQGGDPGDADAEQGQNHWQIVGLLMLLDLHDGPFKIAMLTKE